MPRSRFAKIASVVPKGATCASACFVAFAAGAEKFASYSASIGVHGASDANGQESVGSSAATMGMAKIIKELGVPADIIGRMVVGVAWLVTALACEIEFMVCRLIRQYKQKIIYRHKQQQKGNRHA